jgi:hypothetical protein
MASGIFVNDSGRILVSLFFWIGKRVTTLLPIFFYHKLAQSLLTMGLGRVVTPPGNFHYSYILVINLVKLLRQFYCLFLCQIFPNIMIFLRKINFSYELNNRSKAGLIM